MALHIFMIVAPHNELDGETFELTDTDRVRAQSRADAKVADIFSLNPTAGARAVHCATFASKSAYEKFLNADTVDIALDVYLGDELQAVGT